jgi:hypothetical protein
MVLTVREAQPQHVVDRPADHALGVEPGQLARAPSGADQLALLI